MTGVGRPASELERRYRRLLLAYPGRYRHDRGAEIVTTLLEMAGHGQAHPTVADAWHLVASGVRRRFRLPSGRPLVRVAAVLITLIAGAFGAAAGSWAASLAFTPLPGEASVVALTQLASGTGGAEYELFHSRSPWWTDSTMGTVHNAPGWTPAAARARLTATGWDVSPLPVRAGSFDATREGLLMHVAGFVSPGQGTVSVTLWPADTAALRPATVGGAALGLIAGWLLTAAGAYRMRFLPAARRWTVIAMSTVALASLAVPATAFAANARRVMQPPDSAVYTVHSALSAAPYWSYGNRWLIPDLTVGGLLLAAAAWAALSYHRRTTDPIPHEFTAAT